MKKITIEIQWALVFTLMVLVWMVSEKLAGLHDKYIGYHAIYTNLIAIPAIAIYAFALLNKRKKYYGGTMTYGQGVKCGAIITLVVTVISPLSQYITSKYITPDFFKNMIAYAIQHRVMKKDEAEVYFNLKNFIIEGLIATPVMGMVTTLLVAIFIRKRIHEL